MYVTPYNYRTKFCFTSHEVTLGAFVLQENFLLVQYAQYSTKGRANRVY